MMTWQLALFPFLVASTEAVSLEKWPDVASYTLAAPLQENSI
jgi:hypothetical protein